MTPPKQMKFTLDGIELSMSPAMIEEVLHEFERDNPGRTAQAMTPDEFGDRMMKKIIANARILPSGHA